MSNDIQVRGKEEMRAPAEQTRPGPVYTPVVDIFETDDAIMLVADMPGVKNDLVDIDVRDGQLQINGEVEKPQSESERPLLREYESGRYHRAFSVSDRIDVTGIAATMKDGVLRLTLPKAEKVRPRKIEVKAV
jgi:HSP20 family molecular chaperone IbpA